MKKRYISILMGIGLSLVYSLLLLYLLNVNTQSNDSDTTKIMFAQIGVFSNVETINDLVATYKSKSIDSYISNFDNTKYALVACISDDESKFNDCLAKLKNMDIKYYKKELVLDDNLSSIYKSKDLSKLMGEIEYKKAKDIS